MTSHTASFDSSVRAFKCSFCRRLVGLLVILDETQPPSMVHTVRPGSSDSGSRSSESAKLYAELCCSHRPDIEAISGLHR